ncbi:MAG: aminotransferase class III-fold pyridoxal phosphate-dependent enzyme, partial [Nitrospirota bacterium]|nr:aminotransferase class III-fold pyridoxal phosphate-dependent enzyme [Nitrospirota bacterium]
MDDYGKARTLAETDRNHLWHPFTQMREWSRETPLIIERGEGNYLVDIEGKHYLDGVSSIWCNVHGHRKKELDDALKAQTDRIAHATLLGIANVPSIELAGRLAAIAPKGLTRVFYSDNGSTAVEVALKMAFQYWQQVDDREASRRKTRFVSFYNAYHGDTIGAVSLGGIDLFHAMYRPLLFSTFKVASPYCYRCPFGKEYAACEATGQLACVDAVDEVLRENHEDIAGLIIEPLIQAAAGMLTSPPGYLRAVRTLCSKYDVLMIADEVATGFGKSGAMFACDREGISPDL